MSEKSERQLQQSQYIEALLWRHGLTPNYIGFTYLAQALRLAEEGQPINKDIVTQVAMKYQQKRTTVYSGIPIDRHSASIFEA